MYLVDLVHVYLVDLAYLTDLVYLLAFAVPGLGGGHRKIGFEGTHFPVAPALPFPSRAVRQLPHRDRAALPTVQRQGYQGTFFFFFSTLLLLYSSTRRRFYPQRSSGQAVVTGVVPSPTRYVPSFLFERSEFLIDTFQKKSLRVCLCARGHACSTNLGFSVRSANHIRPKHGIPLPV